MESKVNYGQEFGPNLNKLAKKLLANQNLCKLLINTDLEPLNPTLHPDLTEEERMKIFGTDINIVPLVMDVDEYTTSKIVLVFSDGEPSGTNPDSEAITLLVYVYVPYKKWIIAGEQLRPFAIMSEVRKSLQDKRINGLGEIKYNGFTISSLTTQTGSYLMRFQIGTFN